MTLDLRDLDAAKIARFRPTFERIGREIGRATDTSFQFRDFAGAEPAVTDPRVMTWIDDSIVALGFSRQRMPSGAVHDAQEMARIAPMGMIVIPSVGGISDAPKEFSKAVDISNGADALLNAVMAADKV